MPAPFHDIRILDLSRILAGPWAGQLLADFGAEVIKVEKPGSGDDTRSWGPPFITNADGSSGDAAYFLSTNRGKRSVAIDLASKEGQDLVRALAGQCDALIENFKVGGLKKYGLDYPALSKVNPRLVYCSITGFGQDGPYAKRAGYDFMIQGMGGIMSVTGQPDGAPGSGPMKCGVAFADIFTGLYAAHGIVAALHARHETGRGQHIDMSLLDTQVAVLANQALNYLAGEVVPTRLGNAHPNIVPYQVFATGDGYIIIAVGNDRQFKDLCVAAGIGELAADSRFTSNALRVENRNALIGILEPVIAHKTTAWWMDVLEAAAVPCGPINRIDRVFADEQVRARGLRVDIARGDGTMTPGVANPVRLSDTPLEYAIAAPTLGADTDDVLQRILGIGSEERDQLRKRGVIG